jgi:putative FmdB family regulatory protein
MPVYEYVCVACGHRMEVIHGIHATGPAACDACGGALRRALSAPAIVFKGSGWAKKDARASTRPRERAGSGDGAERGETGSKAREGAVEGGGDGGGAKGSTGASSTPGSGGEGRERGRSGDGPSGGSGAPSRSGD